jgi:hypothetical protein
MTFHCFILFFDTELVLPAVITTLICGYPQKNQLEIMIQLITSSIGLQLIQ